MRLSTSFAALNILAVACFAFVLRPKEKTSPNRWIQSVSTAWCGRPPFHKQSSVCSTQFRARSNDERGTGTLTKVQRDLREVIQDLEKVRQEMEKVTQDLVNLDVKVEEVNQEKSLVTKKIELLEMAIEKIETEVSSNQKRIKESTSEEKESQLLAIEIALRAEKESLRTEKERLGAEKERLGIKENALLAEKARLGTKENALLAEKLELRKKLDGGDVMEEKRVADLTFNMAEKTLQKDDMLRFADRVWDMFQWHSDAKVPKKWLAPYFPVIQSSGSGKTKMMGDFRNATSHNNGDGAMWATTSLNDQSKTDRCGNKANATIIFLLCYQQGQGKPHLGGFFDGAFEVPLGTTDTDRDELLSNLNHLAGQAETERVVFLFDEAQHLLRRQSWHFRCVRWWLRIVRPDHGKQVVAVFAGTTSQLSKFHEEFRMSTNTRDPTSQYHQDGTDLLPPFYQLYTTGLYAWKKHFNMPPNATEFEKSVVFGRPLFAGLLEQSKEEFWRVQQAILLKLLINAPAKDWSTDELAKLSILSTRLQMGETSLQIASELVAKGYATLTAYSEQGDYAQIAHLADPVLARLAMCLMTPEYEGTEIPNNTKKTVNITSWSGYMARAFSSALCLANKGDVGEIGVALYMILCGDRLRYATDHELQTFSIPVDRFLEMAVNPTIKEPNSTVIYNSYLSLNFIQVTRDYLQFRNETESFPLSDWHLQFLYKSARATYTPPGHKLYDMLVPVRAKTRSERGGTHSYVPMLVSIKNRNQYSGNEAEKDLRNMVLHMKELRGDEKGIVLLILVGLDAPQWKSTFSKALRNVTGIVEISYDDQVEKQQVQLKNHFAGQFIVVIREDDPFGVSRSLRSCAVNDGEGALHQSILSIKNAAFKFLEEEFVAKEDLLWYKQSKDTQIVQRIRRLITEQNKKKNQV